MEKTNTSGTYRADDSEELFYILENAAETSCNIPLEKTEIYRILYFSAELFQLDNFKNKFSGSLKDIIFNSDVRRVKLVVKNLAIAIETNCNNKINLDDIVVSKDWGHGCNVDSEIRDLKKRYLNVSYSPDNEELFKKMWLKLFVSELKEVNEAIRYILNEDLITEPQEKLKTLKESNKKNTSRDLKSYFSTTEEYDEIVKTINTQKINGISLAVLIYVLKEKEILTIPFRGNKAFYQSAKQQLPFLTSYQSIFDVKINSDSIKREYKEHYQEALKLF